MAVIPAVLGETQLQNWRFRGLRQDFTHRRVRTPDTCRHSIQGVPSISVLSNSHSVINANHCPYKLSEWKQQAQNNRLLSHVCPGDLYPNIQLQKTDMATNEQKRNSAAYLSLTDKTVNPKLSWNTDYVKETSMQNWRHV